MAMAFVALALGCGKKGESSAADASAPSASVSVAAPAARESSPPAAGVKADLEALANRWNDALRSRNAEALRDVYAKNVRLYGVRMTRDAAVERKAAALAKAPDYTQSIAQPSFDESNPKRPTLVFQKEWTASGKPSSVVASLTFANDGGKWFVVEESDAVTDAKLDLKRDARTLAKAKATPQADDDCEGAVVRAVIALKEAKDLLDGPTNPDGGHSSNGVRVAGGPPESKTFSVAIHENHDDHLATLAWFDVDAETGAITGIDPDQVIRVDPAVTKACARVVDH